jgi:hypothetical protein
VKEDTVACAICGKVVPYSKSRLFFVTDGKGQSGTIRTCQQGDGPHHRKGK